MAPFVDAGLLSKLEAATEADEKQRQWQKESRDNAAWCLEARLSKWQEDPDFLRAPRAFRLLFLRLFAMLPSQKVCFHMDFRPIFAWQRQERST